MSSPAHKVALEAEVLDMRMQVQAYRLISLRVSRPLPVLSRL